MSPNKGQEFSRFDRYALEISDLMFEIDGRVILKEINLKFPAGELIGILGPNGAGKSSLIGVMTGFFPISKGQIKVFGKDLRSISAKDRAKTMALLPQSLETPFHFRAKDVVMMGRYAYATSMQEAYSMAMDALGLCGIRHLADRSFLNLSGGERRLVLLARCLCQNSPIFLLDEATSSLDIRRKMEVFELLKDQVCQKNRSIIIVIHDINLASLYLDRLIFLKNGSIVGQGSVGEILDSKYLSKVFETRTIVMKHPECNRPVVLFSPPKKPSGACLN